jgi:hypothetical protein
MRLAMEDLKLSSIFVIYPGDMSYPLTDKIRVVAWKDIMQVFSSLK